MFKIYNENRVIWFKSLRQAEGFYDYLVHTTEGSEQQEYDMILGEIEMATRNEIEVNFNRESANGHLPVFIYDNKQKCIRPINLDKDWSEIKEW